MCARRIESRASRTADMTCGCRAMSFYESNPMYKGADWVAPMLLPAKIKPFVRMKLTRKLLRRVMGPQGVYEWVIARTRYIDEALIRACKEGFSQILLFGAGFDSRGVRFKAELKDMRVFELDAPTTQKMKRDQFRVRGVEVPPNVVFVPINFEKESVEEKLKESGFNLNQKTLVILEGVLQYLNPEAVSTTFTTIRRIVGVGSRIVFDHAYAAVLRGERTVYGQKRMIEGVDRFGESWQFGLDEVDLEKFLCTYGLLLVDKKSPKELEEMNFKGSDGEIHGRINGTQGIVTAELRS
ncbi:MAG: SAM-dependent methyltransferase [Thermodesulfobacteriota bacterium]